MADKLKWFTEKKNAAAALKMAFVALKLGEAESRKFLVELYADLFQTPAQNCPDVAPELYANRKRFRENPAEFIKRVYAPWLGKGLVRRDLYHLDRQLYFSLNTWRQKHEMPADLDLPTRFEVTDRLLASLGDVSAPNRSIRASGLGQQTRDQQRAYDGRRWRNRSNGESGSVFFTLFGAVALVGVIGAATATLMRGPVGTMVTLNQKAKVDSQEMIAGKLAMLEAAQQPNSGDCDNDGYVEPLPPDLTCASHPTGGGCIPVTIGSAKSDPWGTQYGYCAWDLGTATCGTPGLLDGPRTPDQTKIVFAIISAGADRTFQTTCGADPAYVTTAAGSDGVVLSFTYAEAVQASGGLWVLKSGAPGTATINKNIDVAGSAKFASGITNTGNSSFSNGNINFTSANGFFLPNETNSGACVPSITGSLRTAIISTDQTLQICDPAAPAGPHNHAQWVDVGGAAAGTGVAGANTQVQYNNSGAFGASAALTWNNGTSTLTTSKFVTGSDATVGGNLGVTGNTLITGTLGAGNTIVTGTLNSTGLLSTGDNLTVAKDATITQNLNVTLNSVLGGTLGVTGLSTLTGGELVMQGTAGAPGLGFIGAATTGIYYTSGGVGLTVAGSQHAVVTSSGLGVTGDSTASGNISTATGVVAGAAVNIGAVGSGVGLYSDGAAGLELKTASTPRLQVVATGGVGVDLAGAPTTNLDVGGIMRLRSLGIAAGAACGAITGAITYSSGDQLLVCSSVTGKWETVATSGGGGGGAGSFWTQLGDKRLYYSLADVGVGTANPLANLDILGNFLIEGVYSGTANMPIAGAGTRMVFDPGTGAFRAGSVTGTQWDNGSIGNNSFAAGVDAKATAEARLSASARP